MSHIIVTVKYHQPGQPPVLTTTTVPISNHLAFPEIRRHIIDEYQSEQYYKAIVTLV